MTRRFLIIAMLLLTISEGYSQSVLNPYKYIISSKRFDFQKSEDSYQINSLTKFLFEKQGFVFLFNDEEFPKDLRENPCLALNLKLLDNSTMFKTIIKMELNNCSNKLVFQTLEGESREKDFKKGFHEAIRKAFKSIENDNYRFSPQNVVTKTPEKAAKEPTITIPEQVKQEVKVIEKMDHPVVAEKEINKEKTYQDKVTEVAEIKKEHKNVGIEGFFKSDKQQISIQKSGNQFIVNDAQNNVIGILYATSQPTYFILKGLQSDDNQPKLVYLNNLGDILIDGNKNTVLFKRNR